MRIKEIPVYQFEELSKESQQRALDLLRDSQEYGWFSECRNSLEGFCKLIGVDLLDWSLGGSDNRNYIRVSEVDNLEGNELKEYLSEFSELDKDCPLSGYYLDDLLLEPFREFRKNPTGDFQSLIKESLDSFIKAVRDDVDYQYSDEAILECIAANDYEFLASGKLA